MLAELQMLLPEGWEAEGEMLVCPHAWKIDPEGDCPEGCVSPLRLMGLV